jgi:porin
MAVFNDVLDTMGANGIGWGGSYSAWGGYIKLKPWDWYYVQSGLYVAIPDASTPSNHGLFFAGVQPPERNGLFWLIETGFTPKIGESKLLGRYAAGFIYWGVENTSFFGETYDERVLFYWQVDQQLYREPSRQEQSSPVVSSDGKSSVGGKEVKEIAKPSKSKLSEQGLYFFSLINFAPKYNNPLPFYFHTGLVYRGLLLGRDQDQVGVAFAYGNYSYYKQIADERRGRTAQIYEAVLEFDYRIQLNKWFYAQPLLQYIIRPNGTGLVENATVLGFQLGAIF